MEKDFLPISKKDMEDRGWREVDFVLITGDAYVDHPSFGAAIIGRLLESCGYKVGVTAQPNWRTVDDFKEFGKPKLGFLITAGNMDSMVNHFTAAKKRRKEDEYSPGAKAGRRPDRATIVYTSRAKQAYKNTPVIIGGIEASLRRFAHYDYWEDKLRRSFLIDAKADYLVYGMAEKAIVELAEALKNQSSEQQIKEIRGLCYKTKSLEDLHNYELMPGFDDIQQDIKNFNSAFCKQQEKSQYPSTKSIVQHQGQFFLVQTPPQPPLSSEEMDHVYSLPYTKKAHPIYDKEGGVPAIQEVSFSVTTHRGCFGGCSFCAIYSHQGHIIQNRSEGNILKEVKKMTKFTDFKGIIHDVGGPTANMYEMNCSRRAQGENTCLRQSCLYPSPCPKLNADHSPSIQLLEKIRDIPGVKKVFIRSGIRYDLIMADPSKRYLDNLCSYHISGQMKVAPEHASKRVTDIMHKPNIEIFSAFVKLYRQINESLNKKQHLIPYFISGHPGSTLDDAVILAEYIRDIRCFPEQVQDFTPTPGTLSTAMFYTGSHPHTGEEVYIPKSEKERKAQRALMQYFIPRNHSAAKDALIAAGRSDLIGKGKKHLVPPGKKKRTEPHSNKTAKSSKRRD